MKIAIPLARGLVMNLLVACWHTLLGKQVTVEFDCDDVVVDGGKPVLLSREQVRQLQTKHMETAARAALLEDLLNDVLKDAHPEDPIARELKDGLEVINEPRILH